MTSSGRPALFRREHASRARKLRARRKGRHVLAARLRGLAGKGGSGAEIANDDLAVALETAAGGHLCHAGD